MLKQKNYIRNTNISEKSYKDQPIKLLTILCKKIEISLILRMNEYHVNIKNKLGRI